MNDNVSLHYFREIGHRTFTSESSDWVEIQRGMLISIPFYRLITPSEDELTELIARSGVLGVRYPTSIAGFGFASSLIICRKLDYDLMALTSKSRNQVRKGLKNFEIRTVSFHELATEGLCLNRKTFTRQNRNDPKSDKKYWNKICEACYNTQGIIVYGAYHKNSLAAYMIVLETSNAAEIIIQNSDTEHLGLCPNNILTFTVTSHYLSSNGPAIPVCYGLSSLEATPSLDRFKSNMGYDFEPIKQRLVFSRKIKPFLNTTTLSFLNWSQSNLLKKNYFIRKCHALLDRYLAQSTGNNHG